MRLERSQRIPSRLDHELETGPPDAQPSKGEAGRDGGDAAVDPHAVPVEVGRVVAEDGAGARPAGEHAQAEEGEAHADAGADLGLVLGQHDEEDRGHGDEDARAEAEQEGRDDQAADVVYDEVAEDDNAEDDGAYEGCQLGGTGCGEEQRDLPGAMTLNGPTMSLM